jgi:hypothetical protein
MTGMQLWTFSFSRQSIGYLQATPSAILYKERGGMGIVWRIDAQCLRLI